MALQVNTTEKLTHEDVARRLSRIGQTSLAAEVRQLGQEAEDKASKYLALLREYSRLANSIAKPKPPPGERVSYKPGPMSDG